MKTVRGTILDSRDDVLQNASQVFEAVGYLTDAVRARQVASFRSADASPASVCYASTWAFRRELTEFCPPCPLLFAGTQSRPKPRREQRSSGPTPPTFSKTSATTFQRSGASLSPAAEQASTSTWVTSHSPVTSLQE